MDNLQILTFPVARQVLLHSFFLSQGDPVLQKYLLEAVATYRPHWRLMEEDRQALPIAFLPTVQALTRNHLHCPLSTYKIQKEITAMVAVMAAAFERSRAGYDDLAISILRGFVFRDWRFLCDLSGRPRRGDQFLPHHDPYLSLFCHYLLLGHRTGVAVFDELLRDLAEAVAHRSPIYEGAMEYPSASLCLSEVIAAYQERHPQHSLLLLAQ